MNWKPNHAAVDILPGVQLAELGVSPMIMIVQRAKLIESLIHRGSKNNWDKRDKWDRKLQETYIRKKI